MDYLIPSLFGDNAGPPVPARTKATTDTWKEEEHQDIKLRKKNYHGKAGKAVI